MSFCASYDPYKKKKMCRLFLYWTETSCRFSPDFMNMVNLVTIKYQKKKNIYISFDSSSIVYIHYIKLSGFTDKKQQQKLPTNKKEEREREREDNLRQTKHERSTILAGDKSPKIPASFFNFLSILCIHCRCRHQSTFQKTTEPFPLRFLWYLFFFSSTNDINKTNGIRLFFESIYTHTHIGRMYCGKRGRSRLWRKGLGSLKKKRICYLLLEEERKEEKSSLLVLFSPFFPPRTSKYNISFLFQNK